MCTLILLLVAISQHNNPENQYGSNYRSSRGSLKITINELIRQPNIWHLIILNRIINVFFISKIFKISFPYSWTVWKSMKCGVPVLRKDPASTTHFGSRSIAPKKITAYRSSVIAGTYPCRAGGIGRPIPTAGLWRRRYCIKLTVIGIWPLRDASVERWGSVGQFSTRDKSLVTSHFWYLLHANDL